MNILLLSRYERLGASSRYRSYQYIPHLRSRGHQITVSPLLSDNYLRRLYARERLPIGDLMRSYIRRMRDLLQSGAFDLLWIEYEALPWFPYTVERLVRPRSIPYVVDYDDAVFHRYDMHRSAVVRKVLGRKIDAVMADAAVVIAGNAYLAARAAAAGARKIEIVPTVIDLSRYPGLPLPERRPFRIGWIGSPSTSHFLNLIEPALREVCSGTDTRVVIIGDNNLRLSGVPLESRAWDEVDGDRRDRAVRRGNHAITGQSVGARQMWPETRKIHGVCPSSRRLAGRDQLLHRRGRGQWIPGGRHPPVGRRAESTPGGFFSSAQHGACRAKEG